MDRLISTANCSFVQRLFLNDSRHGTILQMALLFKPKDKLGTEAFQFVAAWLSGILGGALCGAVLSLVIGLLERSPQAVDGFSSPHVYEACLGAYYGSFLGAIVTPFAYPLLIRKLGLRKAFWPAVAGTLVGGFLGVFSWPPLILPLSLVGFLGALAWAAEHYRNRNSNIVTPESPNTLVR
jgi:hypothetical protein